jgi:peptide/nickel transport system substrate-binding protein
MKTKTLAWRRGAALTTVSALALGLATSALAQELRVAFPASSEPANLDYHVDPYTPTMLLNSFMTDPLVVRAPDGSFVPGLAASWEISDDATEVTMTLKEGVTFQDGTPFNAEAVVANFERIIAPETGSALLAQEVGPLASVEAVDDLTVKFSYDEAWVTFLDMASKAPMWSPTAFNASTPQDFDKELIGTGPYKLVEWVQNDYILMETWDGYGGWNSVSETGGPAQVDGVRIQFIAEDAVLGSVVATGESDIAYQLPALAVEQYLESDDAELLSIGQAGVGLQMIFNVRNPPLSDKRLRQAILYARNMDQANQILYDGLYGEADGPLNNIHPCFWEGASEMYQQDLDKAVALLEEAGWVEGPGALRVAQGVEGVEDGTRLELGWSVLHHAEIGEVVQAQLLEIGIGISVEQVPGPIQLERVNARDFEIMYERLRSADPKILDDIWNPAYDQPGGWAWTGYDNPELTALLEVVAQNPDWDTRCQAAKDAQKIIMEEALMIPTLSQPSYFAVSNKVEGFKLGAQGTHFFLHDVRFVE